MSQKNANTVLSVNNGGGAVTSSKTQWFRIGGQGVATDGDEVSSHPPSHLSPRTSNGHGKFRVGGHSVNINGDLDSCGHFRNSSITWFKIDDAL